MEIYYEVQSDEKEVRAFHSLEEAINFADKHGSELICEIGGSWMEYGKCWFCGEWFGVSELNSENECSRCEDAIRDHFGYQERR